MVKVKEIKPLRGGVACYAAQAMAPIDAEIGPKDHLWMETSYIYPHIGVFNMRTIQVTLDDDLVNAVDRVSKQLHTSRSAFTGRRFVRRLPVTALSNRIVDRLLASGKDG